MLMLEIQTAPPPATTCVAYGYVLRGPLRIAPLCGSTRRTPLSLTVQSSRPPLVSCTGTPPAHALPTQQNPTRPINAASEARTGPQRTTRAKKSNAARSGATAPHVGAGERARLARAFPRARRPRRMGFMGFDDLFRNDLEEAADDEACEPEESPVRPWWGPPEGELGVCVPQALIVARSQRGVVALSHIIAYSTGAQFEFTARGRGLKQSQVQSMFHARHFDPSEDAPDSFLRIGLELADGTRVSNLNVRWRGRGGSLDEQPDGPVFHQHGGGGGSSNRGGISMQPGYWLWPLPPPGPVRIWCEWPILDIALASKDIDALPITEAASRPTALWNNPA